MKEGTIWGRRSTPPPRQSLGDHFVGPVISGPKSGERSQSTADPHLSKILVGMRRTGTSLWTRRGTPAPPPTSATTPPPGRRHRVAGMAHLNHLARWKLEERKNLRLSDGGWKLKSLQGREGLLELLPGRGPTTATTTAPTDIRIHGTPLGRLTRSLTSASRRQGSLTFLPPNVTEELGDGLRLL